MRLKFPGNCLPVIENRGCDNAPTLVGRDHCYCHLIEKKKHGPHDHEVKECCRCGEQTVFCIRCAVDSIRCAVDSI